MAKKQDDQTPPPHRPPAAIHPVFVFPTPDKRDLLFYVEVDANLPKYKPGSWTYGDAFPGPPAGYSDYKLVHVSEQSSENWERRWYAKDWQDQDAHNWTFANGDQLIRTYLVKRSLYRQKRFNAGGLLTGEFTYPAGATADGTFTDYGFVEDQVMEAPDPLKGLYIMVQRRYVIPTQTDVIYDDNLEHTVNVTRQVIDKLTATGTSSAGVQVERQYGNKFHDIRVTSTVVLDGGEAYPVALDSFIADVPYRFPQLLRGARMVAAWALADSEEAAQSYDEAWYIKWDLIDPLLGPYEARVLRFLTNNPDGLRADYPIQKIITVREAIGICRAWFHASNKGNSTYAEARQIEVPQAIHGDITIERGNTLSAGQSTNFLPATPQFDLVTGQASMIVAYETKQTRFGLWIVEITEINCSGVYNGVTVPFGTQIATGVDLPDMGANYPPFSDTVIITPSGSFNEDNTVLTGTTSPDAEVLVYNGLDVIGRGVASSSGTFAILFSEADAFTDAVTLTLRAYVDGIASAAASVTTNDRAPDTPSGAISADGLNVSGMTQANATVTILRDAVAQVETATIPLNQTQIERLTVIGTIVGDGDAELTITWPGMTGSPKAITFDVDPADDPDAVATKGAAAALLDVDVAAFLNVTSDGPDIVAEALVADDNVAASLAIDNDTCTGLTPATSEAEREGSSGLITADGTVIATLTSGIAPWTTINVPFQVAVGDDMTDVATKGAAALVLSAANDYYIPASSTNTATVTAREIAVNDPTLSLIFTAGTCEGLPTSGASADTTPGGTEVEVNATSTGAYFYTFSPALTAGDQIQVTATDAGGTSEPLLLEANASPPSLLTAVIADSDTITGTGTVGAKIIAYDGDTDIGDATVGGGGTFTLNTDYKLVRGEVVQVVAVVVGNEDVRSDSIFLTFTDLDLEIPVLELTSEGYVGDVPTGATEIRIRNIDDLTETTATIHTNGTFSFSLAGEDAGQGFDVYARYTTGDSDAVRVFVPTIPKAAPFFRIFLGAVKDDYSAPSNLDTILGYTVDLPWAYKMSGFFQVWMDGMTVTVSFPGSDVADIVVANFPNNADVYQLSPLLYNTISRPFGTPEWAPASNFKIPFDMSGPVPMPYPVVKITLDYPDGDSISATFDAATYQDAFDHFSNGDWNYDVFTSNYQLEKSREYFDAGY